MSVYLWRLFFILSIVLFVLTIIVSIVTNFLKNRYYHQFEKNELIKKTKTANSTNYLYFTSGTTRHYIKKYVVCKTLMDKYLVCNFNQKFKEVEYFVLQYTKRGRVLGVLRINEKNTTDSSKVISLKSKCYYVNVIIGKADGQVINENIIRPLSVNKIRLYSLLRSLRLMFGLFAVRHLIVELLGGNQVRLFLNSSYNYLTLIVILIFALLSYLITVGCLRRKNVKALSGGALEYEFI